MKQTFNLLAEVLALPFSELFFEHDFLAGCIKTAQCKTTDRRSLISALDQQIDQLGPQVAGYINLHTTFTNTATLQNMVNYVYRGEDIVGLSEQFRNCRLPDTSLCIANHYSLTLIHRIANTNTDDPSVFHTSVANEHALVYFALIHQGCSVEDALSAVDELRRAGLESSFLVEVPPFEQLLDEYETILSCFL